MLINGLAYKWSKNEFTKKGFLRNFTLGIDCVNFMGREPFKGKKNTLKNMDKHLRLRSVPRSWGEG